MAQSGGFEPGGEHAALGRLGLCIVCLGAVGAMRARVSLRPQSSAISPCGRQPGYRLMSSVPKLPTKVFFKDKKRLFKEDSRENGRSSNSSKSSS